MSSLEHNSFSNASSTLCRQGGCDRAWVSLNQFERNSCPVPQYCQPGTTSSSSSSAAYYYYHDDDDDVIAVAPLFCDWLGGLTHCDQLEHMCSSTHKYLPNFDGA